MKAKLSHPVSLALIAILAFGLGRATAPRETEPHISPEPSRAKAGADTPQGPSEQSRIELAIPESESATNPWQQKATPGRDRRLANLVHQTALHDPRAAFEQAEQADSWPLVLELKQAAIQWCQGLEERERESLLLAAIRGAALNGPKAMSTLQPLLEDDSHRTLERGFALVNALAQSGQFSLAAEAVRQPDSSYAENWLERAYSLWADHQPEAATIDALQITDPNTSEIALSAAIAGWSRNAPQDLALFAKQMPSGPAKQYAMGEALRQWNAAEPEQARNWLERQPPSDALDPTLAEMAAVKTTGQQPMQDRALHWARKIQSPELRSTTLARIIANWAEFDPEAAYAFARQEPQLSPLDKEDLLRSLPQ